MSANALVDSKLWDNVNLSVEEGTIHAIIGPNGAGKSTLLNCLIGKLMPDTGTVTFEGESLLGRKSYQINQMGVSRVFQTPEIFADLSVFENVLIPCFAKRDGSFELNALSSVSNQSDIREKAEQMLIDVDMIDKRHEIASAMSRGDKRRLEMAMCLAQDPKLLLLDEQRLEWPELTRIIQLNCLKRFKRRVGLQWPLLSMICMWYFRLLKKLRLWHKEHRLLKMYLRILKAIQKFKKPIWECRLMVSSKTDSEKTRAPSAPVYFSTHNIEAYYGESYIVQGVSMNLHEGEILALLGRNGAGKTSTLRAIARLDDPALHHGEVWLDHQPLHQMRAHQASKCGVGLVPEDRRIIEGLTVEENIRLAQIEPPLGWSIERIYELFPRLGERRKQEGTTLSGGEQQMLAIGRALARDIKLLLLDEPYEGLAPVIVHEIEKTLHLIREQGITTIIVEQNAVAALNLADRAIILDTGTVVFDGTAKEVLDNEQLRQEYLAL